MSLDDTGIFIKMLGLRKKLAYLMQFYGADKPDFSVSDC